MISENGIGSDQNNNLSNESYDSNNGKKETTMGDNNDQNAEGPQDTEPLVEEGIEREDQLEENTYPETTIDWEYSIAPTKTQVKRKKRNTKLIINRLTPSLDTIDEDKDFVTVVPKKKKKIKPPKRYVPLESIGDCFREAADRSDKAKLEIQRDYKILETNNSFDKTTTERSALTRHSASNTNYFAPLDPGVAIVVEQYKSAIKERRERNYGNNTITTNNIVNSKLSNSAVDNNKSDIVSTEIVKKNKPSLRQYIESHKETGLNKEMPFMTNQSKQLPLMKQLIENERSKRNESTSNKSTSTTDWNQVGDKKTEKQLLEIYQEHSNCWLPKNLPRTTKVNDKQTMSKTNYIMPLTIKVSRPKFIEQQVQPTRILIAVLGAMQQQFSDSYIGPIIPGSAEIITSLIDIPTDDTLLSNYIEKPLVDKDRTFLIRIIIHSNKRLGQYKEIPQFRQYLAREHIVLDYNELESIDPFHVGFIEDIIPRYETLQLHHERISTLLGEDSPKFQLNIQSVYGRAGE
jgi:hypothetical protein